MNQPKTKPTFIPWEQVTIRNNFMFICTFDPFKRGLPTYTFRNTCQEDKNFIFDDKTQKVFYNVTRYMDESDPKKREILEYFLTGKSRNSLTDRMEDAVKTSRDRREWRDTYMFLFQEIEDAKDEAREEARAEAREEAQAEFQPIIDQKDAEIAALKAQLAQYQKS